MSTRGAKRTWTVDQQSRELLSIRPEARAKARERAYADVLSDVVNTLLQSLEGSHSWNKIFEFHAGAEPRGYYAAVVLAAMRIDKPNEVSWSHTPESTKRTYTLDDVIGTALSLSLRRKELPAQYLLTRRDGSPVQLSHGAIAAHYFNLPVNQDFKLLLSRIPEVVSGLLTIPDKRVTAASQAFPHVLKEFVMQALDASKNKTQFTSFPMKPLKNLKSGIAEDPEIRLTAHAMIDAYLIAHRGPDQRPTVNVLTKFPLGLPNEADSDGAATALARLARSWVTSIQIGLGSIPDSNISSSAEKKLNEYSVSLAELEHLVEQGTGSKHEPSKDRIWSGLLPLVADETNKLLAQSPSLVDHQRVESLLNEWVHSKQEHPIAFVQDEPVQVRVLFWEALRVLSEQSTRNDEPGT